ncbi:hypothetical protein [Micromonospora sp. NPDC048063]|uniref:hypothetical protein n=1 Tax=Micromonospora sp. NPDC048063 TaxID=3364256 RepID=UPI00371C1988
MTYGQLLEQTASAVARVQALLRDPPRATTADCLAVAIARTNLYRAIERQVDRLGGPEYRAEFPQQLRMATGESRLAAPLQQPSAHPVAQAYQEAAHAIRAASDVLNSHFHANTGEPISSEGFAIKAGVERYQNIGALAQLAKAASESDGPLAQWLRKSSAEVSLPIVEKAVIDAEGSFSALQHAATAAIPRPSAAATSSLQQMGPPPLVDDASGWNTIQTPRDFIATLDAARTWLVQNRTTLTASDLRSLARTAMALTYEADYLIGIGSDAAGVTHVVRSTTTTQLAATWRRTARAADQLHSLDRPEPGAGPAILARAEEWLRGHVRDDGSWRRWSDLRLGIDVAAWKGMGQDLTARLPDIATLVNRGARVALHRGQMYEQLPAGAVEMIRRSGWSRASAYQGKGFDLALAASQLRQHSMAFAAEAGVAPTPGLHEADPSNQAGRNEVRARLRRIAATPAIGPKADDQPARQRREETTRSARSRVESEDRVAERRKLEASNRTITTEARTLGG